MMRATDIERRKVLEAIEGDREIEDLVEFKIPYPRLLIILRSFLAKNLIEQRDFKLQLTQAGRDMLSIPVPPKSPGRTQSDRLGAAQLPSVDLDAVHVPKDVLP